MQNVKYLLLIFILSGCVTQKKCLLKYPPEIIRERYDSIIIKDTIIYKDRIVTLQLPTDTVYKDNFIPGLPGNITTRPISLENDYAKASAWIANSRIKLELTQKNQILQFRLDSADKISKHWEFKYLKETENSKQIIREKFVPKIYKVALFICIGAIIFFSAWLYFKIHTGRLKTLLNKFTGK